MSARFATPREIGEIMRLLFRHCKSVDGFAVYEDGWDDSAIAKAVNPELDHHHVRRFRKENFGDTKSQTTFFKSRIQIDEIGSRLENIDRRLAEITEILAKGLSQS